MRNGARLPSHQVTNESNNESNENAAILLRSRSITKQTQNLSMLGN